MKAIRSGREMRSGILYARGQSWGLVCDECPFLAANWHGANKFKGEERTAGGQLRGRIIIKRPLGSTTDEQTSRQDGGR